MLLNLDEIDPAAVISKDPNLLSSESIWVESIIEDIPVETQVFSAMILWERFSKNLEHDVNLKDNFLELIQPAIKRGRDELNYPNTSSNPVVCANCYRYFCHVSGQGESLFSCSSCSSSPRKFLYPILLSISSLFISHESFLLSWHRTLVARLIFEHYQKPKQQEV